MIMNVQMRWCSSHLEEVAWRLEESRFSKAEESSEVRVAMVQSGRGVLLYLLDVLEDKLPMKESGMFI